jgi:hypothetical protein
MTLKLVITAITEIYDGTLGYRTNGIVKKTGETY